MTGHSRAIVPLEAWCYNAPDVRAGGRSVDVGLMAEALLYYDTLLLNPGNTNQLAELLKWFVVQDRFGEFLSLVEDGTLAFLDFAFITSVIQSGSSYQIWNIQDPIQASPNTFVRRLLHSRAVEEAVPRSRDRQQLYGTLGRTAVELKSEAFAPAIEEAKRDCLDERRNAILLQALVDDLWHLRGLGRPPEVRATVAEQKGIGHTTTWNLSFERIQEVGGPQLGFHGGSPWTAAAVCNRNLLAASHQGCDLFLSSPMATLTGDKLYETVRSSARITEIVDSLQSAVEFPDVRALVNNGQLGLDEILLLRRKAARFRSWLQSEADRDRDAIVAYHNEVAKESGLLRAARKSLSIFGVLSGGAVGGAAGAVLAGPIGGALGGGAGALTSYALDIGARLGANWRPVVFGRWMKGRIEEFLADQEGSQPA